MSSMKLRAQRICAKQIAAQTGFPVDIRRSVATPPLHVLEALGQHPQIALQDHMLSKEIAHHDFLDGKCLDKEKSMCTCTYVYIYMIIYVYIYMHKA